MSQDNSSIKSSCIVVYSGAVLPTDSPFSYQICKVPNQLLVYEYNLLDGGKKYFSSAIRINPHPKDSLKTVIGIPLGMEQAPLFDSTARQTSFSFVYNTVNDSLINLEGLVSPIFLGDGSSLADALIRVSEQVHKRVRHTN